MTKEKIIGVLLWIIDWTWASPQNIVGYILSRGWKNNLCAAKDASLDLIKQKEKEWRAKIYLVCYENKAAHWFWKNVSGFGCGRYICLTETEPDNGEVDDPETVEHEWGHIFFSRIVGPFFLLLCGIPSPSGNLISRYQKKHFGWTWEQVVRWYYNLPWEKVADKLAGVDRDKWIKDRIEMGE